MAGTLRENNLSCERVEWKQRATPKCICHTQEHKSLDCPDRRNPGEQAKGAGVNIGKPTKSMSWAQRAVYSYIEEKGKRNRVGHCA